MKPCVPESCGSITRKLTVLFSVANHRCWPARSEGTTRLERIENRLRLRCSQCFPRQATRTQSLLRSAANSYNRSRSICPQARARWQTLSLATGSWPDGTATWCSIAMYAGPDLDFDPAVQRVAPPTTSGIRGAGAHAGCLKIEIGF